MKDFETIESVCTYCGVGCDIAAEVFDNKIQKIFAYKDGVVSEGKLCIKGKYGFDFVDSKILFLLFTIHAPSNLVKLT